jgi:WD40 repeat protein
MLCYLQGQSHREAAGQLGCSVAALNGRLQRGRELLRQRLFQRGLTLTGAALATVLEHQASAAVPAAWVQTTVQAALKFTAGEAVGGALSATALALARDALPGLGTATIKLLVAVLLAVGALGLAAGLQPGEREGPVAEVRAGRGAAQAAESPPAAPVRRDLHGDPLPPGVRQRLGTMRLRHDGEIGALHFFPDGKTLVSSGGSSRTWLWDVTTGKPIRSFTHAATSASFSPDGKTMAAGQGNVVRLWDVATGKEIGQLAGHTRTLVSTCFSGDGKALASCDKDDFIRLWDVATGQELRQFDAYTFRGGKKEEDDEGEKDRRHGCIHRVTYAADGKTLISEGGAVATILWDAATGKKIRELNDVWCYSPDGKIVASGRDKITLWEAATGKEIHLLPGKEPVHSVCFAPDGKTLAAVGGTNAGTNQLWDVTSGKLIRQWTTSSYFNQVRFAPDGKTLAATDSFHIHLFESATGKEIRTLKGQVSWNRPPSFAPDGKTLAASCDDLIRLWDVATGQELHRFRGHTKSVVSVRYAPDGKTLASAGSDNRVRLWDATSGQEIHLFAVAIQWGFPTPEFAQGGKTLCVAGGFHEIQLLDTATGKERRHFRGHHFPPDFRIGDGYEWLSCAPDGKTLVTTGFDRVIRLWDVANGKEICQFSSPGMCGPVRVSFAPDGKTLASLHAHGESGICRLWDVASGKEIRRLEVGPHGNLLCYAPDGQTLATTNGADTIQLWDVASGQLIRQLRRDGDGKIRSLSYAPDGQMLAASWDRTIGLWEVASGKEIRRFAQPPFPHGMNQGGGAGSVAFAPDGLTLAAGYDNGIVLLWDVTGQRPDGRFRAGRLAAQQQEALWGDLAGDAGKAYAAVWALVAAPQQAVPLLQGRLQPAVAADPQKLARLIARLDSEQFAERQQAMAELEKLGDLATPALSKLLDSKPALELRRRAEKLLHKLLVAPVTDAELLRGLRAVAVLEHIGNPEACALLKRLAGGAPGVRLTREAGATLARLADRAVP